MANDNNSLAEKPNNGFVSKNIKLTNIEFEAFRSLVYDQIGLYLSDKKKALVSGRLQKVLRKHNFESYSEYYDYIRKDETGQAISELINRITTNHTFFFREREHFDFFSSKALPEVISQLKSQKSGDIRIWCAGCSTGEEAYTMMILMMEAMGNEYWLWDAGLLATDISENALNTAVKGVYTKDRIQPIPPHLKHKYFIKNPDDTYEVIQKIKKEIVFRRFNLTNQTFPFFKQFQIIFCRNVMIYFDQETRNSLVERFYNLLAPGGYLFIGHSESIRHSGCKFNYLMPAVYQKGD